MPDCQTEFWDNNKAPNNKKLQKIVEDYKLKTKKKKLKPKIKIKKKNITNKQQNILKIKKSKKFKNSKKKK